MYMREIRVSRMEIKIKMTEINGWKRKGGNFLKMAMVALEQQRKAGS